MSNNALALKYGTHNIDNILATLPIEEAEPLIREYLKKEVESEIADRYEGQIEEAEEEACNQESRADDLQSDIEGMAFQIKQALESNSESEMRKILIEAKRLYSEHF